MMQSDFRRRVCRRGFTLTDLVTCLCIAVLCVAAVASPLENAREQANRVKCAANLRQIGLAIQMYANENKGNFPRTRFDTKHTDLVTSYSNFNAKKPFEADGPDPNDVTSAFFLLVRTQELDVATFVCPSSSQRPIPFGDESAKRAAPEKKNVEGETDPAAAPIPPAEKPVAKTPQDISNFPGPEYLSYSYINPYPSVQARNSGFKLNYTLTSDFAIGSDINPGGAGPVKVKREDLPAPYKPNARREPAKFTAETKAANSPNHAGFGQNVLYADGHIEFQPTPWCGMKRSPDVQDNIFTNELPKRDPKAPAPEAGEIVYTDPINGPAMDEKDSILLPTVAKKKDPPIPAGDSERTKRAPARK